MKLILIGLLLAGMAWGDPLSPRELFQMNCTACHGPDGEGDGPAAQALDPRPANLTRTKAYKHGHDYPSVFKSIRQGVDNTGMAPWEGRLTDAEIGTLAHYVVNVLQNKKKH